jgi:hypothetical protein
MPISRHLRRFVGLCLALLLLASATGSGPAVTRAEEPETGLGESVPIQATGLDQVQAFLVAVPDVVKAVTAIIVAITVLLAAIPPLRDRLAELGVFPGAGSKVSIVRPEVSIVRPVSGDQVIVRPRDPPWFGEFDVIGESDGVENNPELRIYVLSRRTKPQPVDFYLGRDTKPAEGRGGWRAVVVDGWEQDPARAGVELDLIAVAAKPSDVTGGLLPFRVSHHRDLKPAAVSKVVHITIAAVSG